MKLAIVLQALVVVDVVPCELVRSVSEPISSDFEYV